MNNCKFIDRNSKNFFYDFYIFIQHSTGDINKMRIDNNYTQKQPNFGRLKSITYQRHFNPDIYPEEFAKLLKTIKESKAFNDFFKQYDVDMYFHEGEGSFKTSYVYMTLKTTVPKTKGNNLRPTLYFGVDQGLNESICSTYTLLNRLIPKIKNIEFSDLKYKLDDALKELEENEKTKNARTEIDEITNSILTKDSPEKSKKKTFFEKLFGWLK